MTECDNDQMTKLKMKKIFALSFIILLTVKLFAQKDAQATAILKKVSEKYRSFDVVKTDFYFTIENQQASMHVTQSGTMLAKTKNNHHNETGLVKLTHSKLFI